jgi:dihydropyrimidinase
MTKVLIKGGRIVTAVDDYQGDILIQDGRIEAIGRQLTVDNVERHDATGLLVLPGGIDAHVHMETPMGNDVYTCDSFETGTNQRPLAAPPPSSILPSSSTTIALRRH